MNAELFTEGDFESLSWHDCETYGFRLENFNPDFGSADLIFDINYEYSEKTDEDKLNWYKKRTELRFHEVFGLKFELDYETPTAGMCPFSIHDIERELLEYQTGNSSYRWRISINWPQGSIAFDAPKFTQKPI